MSRPPNDAIDVYQDTIRRLEPDIHMIDDGAGWASIAISLKRIADEMVEGNRLLRIMAVSIETMAINGDRSG